MRDGRGEDWGFGGNDRYAEYKERRIRGIRKKKRYYPSTPYFYSLTKMTFYKNSNYPFF